MKAALDAGLPLKEIEESIKRVSKSMIDKTKDKEKIATKDIREGILSELGTLESKISESWRRFDKKYKDTEIEQAIEEAHHEQLEEEALQREEEKIKLVKEEKEEEIIKRPSEEGMIARSYIQEERVPETAYSKKKEQEAAYREEEQHEIYKTTPEQQEAEMPQGGLEQGVQQPMAESQREFSETPGTSDDLRERFLEQTGRIPFKIIDSEDITRKELKKAHLGKN